MKREQWRAQVHAYSAAMQDAGGLEVQGVWHPGGRNGQCQNHAPKSWSEVNKAAD